MLEDKWHELANKFVHELTNYERKVLGILVLHEKGLIALEDEIASALHDQTHNGDPDAFRVLRGDEEYINGVLSDK